MSRWLRLACAVGLLALATVGCDGMIEELVSGALGGEEALPLYPMDAIPIAMEARVQVESREAMAGDELNWLSADWTHQVSGHVSQSLGWQQETQGFIGGYAQGRTHCYSPCGPEHDVVATWASELALDDPREQPEFILRLYDDEALVLYGVPTTIACEITEVTSPECCGIEAWWWGESGDEACRHDVYLLFEDADRAPDADSSSLAVVQSGVVLLRIPLEELREGGTLTANVNLVEHDGDWEHRLDVALTLTAE